MLKITATKIGKPEDTKKFLDEEVKKQETPQPQEVKLMIAPQAPQANQPVQVIRNEKGEKTGVIRDGKTFLGLNDADVQNIAEAQNRKIGKPEGTLEAADVKRLQEQQQVAQEQASQLSIPSANEAVSFPQESLLKKGVEVGGSAVKGAATGGATGAVALGALGSVIPIPGIGTAVGAAVGGVGGAAIGFVGGAFKAVSKDEKEDIDRAMAVYTSANQNIKWIINNANQGRINPIQAREMWEEEVGNILAAERHLKEKTSRDLNYFTKQGFAEQEKIERTIRLLPQMQVILENAMIKPNPNLILSDMETTNENA